MRYYVVLCSLVEVAASTNLLLAPWASKLHAIYTNWRTTTRWAYYTEQFLLQLLLLSIFLNEPTCVSSNFYIMFCLRCYLALILMLLWYDIIPCRTQPTPQNIHKPTPFFILSRSLMKVLHASYVMRRIIHIISNRPRRYNKIMLPQLPYHPDMRNPINHLK